MLDGETARYGMSRGKSRGKTFWECLQNAKAKSTATQVQAHFPEAVDNKGYLRGFVTRQGILPTTCPSLQACSVLYGTTDTHHIGSGHLMRLARERLNTEQWELQQSLLAR